MVHRFQNIWFNKRTHSNEQRNGHRLSTKWLLASNQSSVRSWPCAANQGVVVCSRAVCWKGLCINQAT